MSDKPQNDLPPSAQDQQQQPSNPARRRFLAGATALGVGASIAPLAGAAAEGNKKVLLNALPQSAQNSLLRRYVKNVVVIYAENRSFNNLFANFPGVEKPLSALKPDEYQQRDRDGQLLDTLPPIWKGLVPKAQEVGHVNYKIDEDAVFTTQLPNQPFVLTGPQGENLPHGVVTRDLWHVFYQNQMQINGGKNDKFVAWADSGALTMGYYGDGAYNLRLWTLAQEFTLCDNFFQGAFGGSFLNHQYLICARPPFYPDVQNSVAKDGIAQLESDDVTDWRLKPLSDSPVSASFGIPLFGKSLLTPDGYAVNTMAPPYWPSWTQDEKDPTLAVPPCPTLCRHRNTRTLAICSARKGSIGPGTPVVGSTRWTTAKIRVISPAHRIFSIIINRSITLKIWGRPTRRRAKLICVMAALAIQPPAINSWRRWKRAPCRRSLSTSHRATSICTPAIRMSKPATVILPILSTVCVMARSGTTAWWSLPSMKTAAGGITLHRRRGIVGDLARAFQRW